MTGTKALSVATNHGVPDIGDTRRVIDHNSDVNPATKVAVTRLEMRELR